MKCFLLVLFDLGSIFHVLLQMLMNKDWAIECMLLILAIVNPRWHHWFYYSTWLDLCHRVNELRIEHSISWKVWIIWRVLYLLRTKSISMSGSISFLSTLTKLIPLCLPSLSLLLFLNHSLFFVNYLLLSFNVLEQIFVLREYHIVRKYFGELLIEAVHLWKSLQSFKFIIVTP